MKICPICKNKVSAFHPGSHLIPKFMIHQIKDGHQAVNLIKLTKKRKASQSGISAEIICDNCEALTSKFDSWAATIFRDNKLRDKIQKKQTSIHKYEVWPSECSIKIIKFAVSVVVRWELYAKKENLKCVLSDKYLNQFSRFLIGDKDIVLPTVILCRLEDESNLENIIYYPTRCRLENHIAVCFSIPGFRFDIITTSHKLDKVIAPLAITSNDSFLVLTQNVRETKEFQNILKSMTQMRSKGLI